MVAKQQLALPDLSPKQAKWSSGFSAALIYGYFLGPFGLKVLQREAESCP